jgi:hypothetical protein
MAMTDRLPDPVPASDAELGLEPDDLDGHTIEELSDYLDAGETPADPSIDTSPGCQSALSALRRLRVVSLSILEAEAQGEPAPDEGWISGLLHDIGREARAGRRIPVPHPDPAADLAVTEGSVRSLIRAAGDDVGGLLIGRCRLEGDVTTIGAPVSVHVDASAYWTEPIPAAADRLREAIRMALLQHTDLVVTAIDITVHDIHGAPASLDDQS